ncbi:BlaI/MecI/CopY family transcriptional regulator [Qingrenia yutianensis]|uniref:BlaI/MecI/CopY family transcriptional regulator n=1 Tax=Qingrenia yutianensis TaxID=2763676 RepID=A0A926FFK2_9FIRM|nr:BlaI/MecI/CopY family transcriptional regulator [Qingrenia yutianensis]MBC8597280.1 BlaI/MecI/CopY family transcriptional regulator [Qingrenia yutianensis]
MKNFEKRLPDAELEIMKVIWHNECPISTSEVKRIIDEESNAARTQQTVQTLINRLIAKEYIAKDKRGKEYIYTPLVAEKDYVEFESERFLRKMHGNSITNLMRALFDSKKISDEDISELEKMFKEKRK